MRIAYLKRTTIMVILILLAAAILAAIFRGKPKKLDMVIEETFQKTESSK